jgi:hypothetical protein
VEELTWAALLFGESDCKDRIYSPGGSLLPRYSDIGYSCAALEGDKRRMTYLAATAASKSISGSAAISINLSQVVNRLLIWQILRELGGLSLL